MTDGAAYVVRYVLNNHCGYLSIARNLNTLSILNAIKKNPEEEKNNLSVFENL